MARNRLRRRLREVLRRGPLLALPPVDLVVRAKRTAYAASFRYQPQAYLAARLIREGAIGPVQEVECVSHYDWPRLAPYGWPHRLDQGGGRLHRVNPARVPRRIVMLLIRGYQLTLSHLVFTQCRFTPSCSRYTYEAVERFGALKGSWLGIRRIMRCHPFHPGGFDPVPKN